MWNRLGPAGRQPPATYYHYKYKPHGIFWHMLDQVVLRPAVLPLFPEAELKIIGEVGGSSLLKTTALSIPTWGRIIFPCFFASTSHRWQTMVENLWPDFARGQRRTIKTILMELGSGIDEKTEGAIEFLVETDLNSPEDFTHSCQLHVVSIDYYYPFRTVTHSLSMFPVTTTADGLGQPVVSATEAEFVAVLKQIITADATRNVVEQLLDAVV